MDLEGLKGIFRDFKGFERSLGVFKDLRVKNIGQTGFRRLTDMNIYRFKRNILLCL